MKVKITQQHIDGGMAHTSKFCPVALAITDAIKKHTDPPYFYVSVHGRLVIIHTEDQEYDATLPPSVAEFSDNFDNNRPVTPIEFTL